MSVRIYRHVHRLRTHRELCLPDQRMPDADAEYVRGLIEAAAIVKGRTPADGEALYAKWLANAEEPPCDCEVCEVVRKGIEGARRWEAAGAYLDAEGFRVVPTSVERGPLPSSQEE